MRKKTFTSDLLLLLTSAIWGFAFVAQRAGMEFIGPFLYNAVRFALGSLSLVPLVLFRSAKRAGAITERKGTEDDPASGKTVFFGSLLAGAVLFLGASLQQIGLVYTTAGKAGFITGLYVILVPMLGIFLRHRTGLPTWVGAALAVIGLYLLSVTGDFRIARGDLLVLTGSIFWAFHVLIIDHFTRRMDPVLLACIQFAWCSVFSSVTAGLTEPVELSAIIDAAVPILYGGLCSVGIAYTLQVVAQRYAPPAHAAIILSMEGVFAVIGGIVILDESLSAQGWTGAALMLAGMLATQWDVLFQMRKRNPVG